MPDAFPNPPLFPWPMAAAGLLAFCGGYGDATGYLLAKTFTGHVTGNLVLLALALPGAHPSQILPRVVAIACYLAGTGAGFLLTGWDRRRATPAAFVAQAALLLAIVAPQVRHAAGFPLLLILALSLALGLQNGLVTSIAGVSLHPTFLSGDFTTLVSTWVKAKQGGTGAKPPHSATAPVLLAVIGSFFVGAATARIVSVALGDLLPASLLLPLLAATLVYERNVRL